MRERKVAPSTIHAAVKSVKLHWHLGIFNFILRLTLRKRYLHSFKSAATRNAKLVYCNKNNQKPHKPAHVKKRKQSLSITRTARQKWPLLESDVTENPIEPEQN